MDKQDHVSSSMNDSGTSGDIGTPLTQPRSADVLRFKIKVPKTLEQPAKLRKWLECTLHTLTGKAHRYAANLIYQIKGAKTQADLDRLQPYMAYQAARFDEATGAARGV